MVEIPVLFDMLEKVEARADRYWNFYTLVVLAVGGWLFTKEKVLTTPEALAVAAGLGAFFLANLAVLHAAVARLTAIEHEIAARARVGEFATEQLSRELNRGPIRHRLWLTAGLHLFVDAVVIAAVLLFGTTAAG